MRMKGTLEQYLTNLDRDAQDMFDLLMKQYAEIEGVTKFAEGVFRNAKALKSVTMSANASIYVGQEAFRNCVTLSDITARIAAVDDGAFRNCISLRAITFVSSGIEYIGSNAFNGCVLIQKVSIPSSVVAIGDSAFDGCRGITSLTFESNETLQTIGYSAFGGCSLLTAVQGYTFLPFLYIPYDVPAYPL